MDPNKLANLRRYILRAKKMSEIEIEHLKERIHNENTNTKQTTKVKTLST